MAQHEHATHEQSSYDHPDFDPHEAEHSIGLGTYFAVFAALMVLLWITVWAYWQDFSHLWAPANLVIALAIAVTKMLCIMMIFMHVKYSSKLVKVFVMAGYLFVIIMFCFTLMDYTTREWLPWWVPGHVLLSK